MSKKQSNPLPSKGMVKPAPPPSPYTKISISTAQLEVFKKVSSEFSALRNEAHKINMTMEEFINALAKCDLNKHNETKENNNERT